MSTPDSDDETATESERESEPDDENRERECQQCGRERPANPQRFTVTASDFTPATTDFEEAHFCYECWRVWLADLRRATS